MRSSVSGFKIRRIVHGAAFLFLAASSCFAVTNYTVALADPDQHLLEVQILLREGEAERELQLPVWNALYQVRDFSQYVNWVRAKDRAGREIPIHEINASRWKIEHAQDGVIVEYQIFADSPAPFGAQFNLHHAFFNLAEILMYPVEARNEQMNVRFTKLPEKWRVATPLAEESDGRFRAENYHRLVDSPIEIGTFQETDFDEGGAHYRVVVDADAADYSAEKLTAMLRRIVDAATGWMDDRPYSSYMFLYHFPHGPAGGGMEHAYSTAISLNADVLTRAPEVLASISAHEFFHLWNVKRIRPQTLEPIDYTKENYTRALWFSEGCTNTAADFIELRSGTIDERRFEQELASDIADLERRPAHLRQSAEQSSLDAWLEGYAYYRRPLRSVSYYNKGEVLGIALDLAMRRASRGEASLRELFQWMNQNYAKRGRFFADSDGVKEAAEAVSHADLGWFFHKYVAGAEEIPWDEFFRVVGLRLVASTAPVADAGFIASRNFDGPMVVGEVTSGGAAEQAGLQAGDTILEINGNAVGQESTETISAMTAGESITVKVRPRRGTERELKWKMGSRQEVSYELKDVDKVTTEQSAARAAWLKGEAQRAAH